VGVHTRLHTYGTPAVHTCVCVCVVRESLSGYMRRRGGERSEAREAEERLPAVRLEGTMGGWIRAPYCHRLPPSSTQVGRPIHKSLLFLRALNSLTSSNDAVCKGMRRRRRRRREGRGGGQKTWGFVGEGATRELRRTRGRVSPMEGEHGDLMKRLSSLCDADRWAGHTDGGN